MDISYHIDRLLQLVDHRSIVLEAETGPYRTVHATTTELHLSPLFLRLCRELLIFYRK